MGNPWIAHLKGFHKSHKNMSYKEAMKAAKKTYTKVGTKSIKAKPANKSRKAKSKKSIQIQHINPISIKIL